MSTSAVQRTYSRGRTGQSLVVVLLCSTSQNANSIASALKGPKEKRARDTIEKGEPATTD